MCIVRNNAEPCGIIRGTENLYDENSNMNVVGSVLTSAMTFPNGFTNKARTYFILCKPNTYYRISMAQTGDRLFIYSLNNVVDPTMYTYTNRLTFDSELVGYLSDIPSAITVKSPENAKMLAFYTSTTNAPTIATGVQINEIISAKKVVRTTRNLFDKDRFIISDSYLTKDNIVIKDSYSVNWGISEYILINSNYVVLSGVLGLSPGFCLYDGNKNFIYGQKYDGNIGTVSSDSIIVDTRGAKYIRVSVKRQNLDIFQLELGTEATPYVPHTITIWQPEEV